MGEGESEKSLRKTSPAACRRGSKKGRTTPLYLEGLKVTHLGLLSIYLYNITAGNFYSSDNGKKE